MVDIDKYTVKIECVLEEGNLIRGSGVIFPMPDYDYIITALHCLKGENFDKNYKEIKIIQKITSATEDKENIREIKDSSLIFESKLNFEEEDFAIIRINEKFTTLLDSNIYISRPKEGEKFQFSSYPSSQGEGILSKIKGNIKNFKTSNLVRIGVDSGAMNFTRKANEKIGGASGSGVFQVQNDTAKLVGILTDVGNIENAHNELIMLDIAAINNYLKNHADLIGLDDLVNEKFENYLDIIFDDVGQTYCTMKEILVSKAKELKGFELIVILELIEREIFLPQNEGNLNDKKLWKGWLEYLTLILLLKGEEFIDWNNKCLDIDAFSDFLKEKHTNLIKFVYSDLGSMPIIIKEVYENDDFYNKLNQENKIIINSFAPDTRDWHPIRSDRFKQIVKDICEGDECFNITHIDNPKINKKLSFFHLENLKSSLKCPENQYNGDSSQIELSIIEILKRELCVDAL